MSATDDIGKLRESLQDLEKEGMGPVVEVPRELIKDLEEVSNPKLPEPFGPFSNRTEETLDDKKYIRSKDRARLAKKFKNPRVLVVDLAKEEDRKRYEEVMELFCANPPKHLPYSEEEGPIVQIDPKSKAGYRCIMIVRYAEVEEFLRPLDQPYQTIPSSDKKEQ